MLAELPQIAQLLDPYGILAAGGVQEGSIVADLGSGGVGHLIFPASKVVGESGHVYAIDILKSVLSAMERRIQEENIKNMTLVWSDLEVVGAATQIKDGSVDVAFLSNTLFQSKKKDKMFLEAKRMLKAGGTLVVVEWKKVDAPMGPDMSVRTDPSAIRQIADQTGFEEQNEFNPGQYHFGIVFRKK